MTQIQSINNVATSNLVADKKEPQYKVADYPNDKFEKQGAVEPESKKQTGLNKLDAVLLGVATASTAVAAFATHKSSLLKESLSAMKGNLSAMNESLGSILKSVGKEVPEATGAKLKTISDVITVDDMTGLFNKACLKTNLPKDFSDALKSGDRFTVGMLDMDNFKGINEVFSHDIGDDFIKRIAANIKEGAQKYGAKGYRYGGEEFVVAVKGQDSATSKKMFEEISNLIKNDKEIQAYLPEFKEKAKSELDFLTAQLKKLDADNPSNVFSKLRNVDKLRASDKEKLASEVSEILSGYVETYKPANASDLKTLVAEINKKSGAIDLKTKVGENSTLGKELDKISFQYNGHKPELDKWLNHVNNYDMFTVSGGFLNTDKNLVEEKNGMKLVNIADEALSSAKNMGKNTITEADDSLIKKGLEEKKAK